MILALDGHLALHSTPSFQSCACPFDTTSRSYHHLFPISAFEELSGNALLKHVSTSGRKHPLGITAASAGTDAARLACFGCIRDLSRAVKAAEESVRGMEATGTSAAADNGAAAAVRGGTLAVPMVLRCGRCTCVFCYECDNYVHESLHNCPGCEVFGDLKAGGAG